MRLRVLLSFVAFVSVGSYVRLPAEPKAQLNEPPTGFSALFNGKDLSGWYGLKTFDPYKLKAMDSAQRNAKLAEGMKSLKEHWSVEDGVLINDGHGDYMTSKKEFGDIELFVDYRTVPKADSGIYLRGCPQVQIWDHTNEAVHKLGADKGSGGLWNNAGGAAGKDPLVLADKPFGEWNRFRILQVGERTTVYLNGQLVVEDAVMDNYFDRSRPLYPRGSIQLQTHGGKIEWRNIFVREILPGEANAFLSRAPMRPIFNGNDLSGWAGEVDSYEVVEGAIQCKPGKGGTVYFNEVLSDFVVRFEFQLSPGGNNGLAIRFDGGKGDPAYDAMCELQVLDNTSPNYAALDSRQYHGSAYGMVPAHRGYLRPVGEWNFQQVTVVGSTVKVELNGTTILRADLSQVTKFMDDTAHPGKDRRSGFFGFAGHGDPVRFRAIALMRL